MDYGDVCLNYDKAYFAEKNWLPPQSLEDLLKPEYKSLLVVENPATSSPGLAFLLATIGHFGADGYLDYWKGWWPTMCRWSTTGRRPTTPSSAAHRAKAPRPMVVSYSSSPAVRGDLCRHRR